MNLYDKDRDHIALGRFYTDHVSAMTREGLHAKSDIAAELAFRDQRITELERANEDQDIALRTVVTLLDWSHVQSGEVGDRVASVLSERDELRAKLAEYEQAPTVAWVREPTEDECREIGKRWFELISAVSAVMTAEKED